MWRWCDGRRGLAPAAWRLGPARAITHDMRCSLCRLSPHATAHMTQLSTCPAAPANPTRGGRPRTKLGAGDGRRSEPRARETCERTREADANATRAGPDRRPRNGGSVVVASRARHERPRVNAVWRHGAAKHRWSVALRRSLRVAQVDGGLVLGSLACERLASLALAHGLVAHLLRLHAASRAAGRELVRRGAERRARGRLLARRARAVAASVLRACNRERDSGAFVGGPTARGASSRLRARAPRARP